MEIITHLDVVGDTMTKELYIMKYELWVFLRLHIMCYYLNLFGTLIFI